VAREWNKLVPHEGGESSAGATKREWQTIPHALTQVARAGDRYFFGDENGGLEVRGPQGKELQTLP
jgi:hypothetical protein